MAIVFIRNVHVSLYGASKTRNPLTVRRDIIKTHLVQNAPDIFRINHSFSTLQESEKFLMSFYPSSERGNSITMNISLRIKNKNLLKRYLNQVKFTFSIVNAAETVPILPIVN
jgi:hypothetical protein